MNLLGYLIFFAPPILSTIAVFWLFGWVWAALHVVGMLAVTFIVMREMVYMSNPFLVSGWITFWPVGLPVMYLAAYGGI